MFVRFLIAFIFIASTIHAQETILSHADLNRIEWLRENSGSDLVRNALDEEQAFREATQDEIEWFLDKIESASPGDLSDVKLRVLQRMRSDLAAIIRINQEFSRLQPGTGAIGWSCKTNKLVEIITEAISLFEEQGDVILRGQLPQEFDGYWSHPRCLGKCADRNNAHNHRELALKASLLLSTLELNQHTHLVDAALKSLDASSIVHSTPLPKNIAIEGIQNLSFFYNGTHSPLQGELAFVHGGYAFGGQNDDHPYARFGRYGKRFGPQDCSSWMSKFLRFPQVMSTADFAGYYKDLVALEDGQCPSSGTFARYEAVQKLIPANVQTLEDVQSGMVFVTRRFDPAKDPSMSTTLGTSGHVLMVVDVDLATNSFLAVEYNRDLPNMEGFGVRRLPFGVQANVKAMFFNVED